jgi:hypothetical protein
MKGTIGVEERGKLIGQILILFSISYEFKVFYLEYQSCHLPLQTWCMSVIRALRRWRQQDHEFIASLGYVHMKTLSQKKKSLFSCYF